MSQENKDKRPIPTTMDLATKDKPLRGRASPVLRSQGAEVHEAGVCYRTWCKHDRVGVVILDDNRQVLDKFEWIAAGIGALLYRPSDRLSQLLSTRVRRARAKLGKRRPNYSQ